MIQTSPKKCTLDKIKILSGAQLKYIAFVSMLIDHVNKALIYFNRAWALDASDKDCEKAINLLISKNKKAL